MRKVLVTLVLIIYLALNTHAQEFNKKIDALIGKAVKLHRINGTVVVSSDTY
jgi:uncharacterized membrane-anchored protein YjiN (DUF445 family)